MSGTHHFLTDHQIGTSPIHRLDPRVKIIGFLALTIVGVDRRSIGTVQCVGCLGNQDQPRLVGTARRPPLAIGKQQRNRRRRHPAA